MTYLDFNRSIWAVTLPFALTLGCTPSDPVSADGGSSGSTTDTTVETPGDTTIDTAGDTVNDTEVDTTAASAECGNGVEEPGEECDDGGQSATCDDDCSLAVCGDGTINPLAAEECDGDDLAGAECADQGFDGGALSCDAQCQLDTTACGFVPEAPTLAFDISPIKHYAFSWNAVDGAEHYQVEVRRTPADPFLPVGGAIGGISLSYPGALHLWAEADFRVLACNMAGCSASAEQSATGSPAEAIGYFKASSSDDNDFFGYSVALSDDGTTLAVGSNWEASNATGIDGDPTDNSMFGAGAVHVFVRDAMGQWSQQAYVKASNTDPGDWFGASVALSADGSTLAVGARNEQSGAAGIDGDQADDAVHASGATYVFARDGQGQWSQQAYIKSSHPDGNDFFGGSVALDGSGDTLAVGASWDDSSAAGVGGDAADDSMENSGAVYVFARDGGGQWSQHSYIKAAIPSTLDYFGTDVALSTDGNTLAAGATSEGGSGTGAAYVFEREAGGQWSQRALVKAGTPELGEGFGRPLAVSGDGSTLAVGAAEEDSNATGVDGDETNDASTDSGAVYVYARDAGGQWSQQAYIKATNTGSNDYFGSAVTLSADGSILAAGAFGEDGDATGIGGTEASNTATDAGAAYVYTRNEAGQWTPHAYIKASNSGIDDAFGFSVALSADGRDLAVGAYTERSNATGIGGDQTNDSFSAGAVYLY